MSKITLLLGFFSGLSSLAFAADAKLALVGNPLIVVDPFCNPDGTATGKAKIRNEGSAGTATISLFLAANDVTSKPAGKIFNGKVVPIAINGPNDDQPSGKKTIGPGEEVWIKIDASKVGEGEWEAVLQNENVDIGKVRIIRNELPFPISMDVPAPDAPELTFVKGHPASFRLKNDGPNNYLVTWEYSIDGHTLRPTDAVADTGWWSRLLCRRRKDGARQSVASSPVELPRNGLTPVNFHLPADWFGSRFTGLFKDNAPDGHLMISRVDPACSSVISTKVFKIKTHLATNSGSSRELWSDFWIFWILLLGGICSLTLNFALPNQMRRQKLKEKLQTLGRQVSDLSTDLASRLRVLAGLEQRLLGDRLRNLRWTNSDFASEMQNIEQAATRLGTRLQLLDRLGTTRSNFEKLRSLTLPPTIIVSMDALFEKVVAIGKKSDFTDADIQAAQTLIQTLQDQMDSRGKSNAAWVSGLAERVKTLQAEFAPTGATGKSATWKSIQGDVTGALTRLQAANPAQIPETDYLVLDRDLFRLELVVNYVRQVEPLASTDPVYLRIKEHAPDLLNALKYDSWEQLDLARRLVDQMRQGQFAKDISQAVVDKTVNVKRDRILIRQFEPCGFRLELPSSLDNATARDEWTCKWEFSNPNEETLYEEGWDVTHYFQRPEHYQLKVTLINKASRESHDIDPSAAPAIEVQGEKRRRLLKVLWNIVTLHWGEARKEWNKSRTGAGRVLEVLWLVLALFLALIGMIAGAKEQVLKLEVVPAMIAIFLVGFGADQVKNLLTHRQS